MNLAIFLRKYGTNFWCSKMVGKSEYTFWNAICYMYVIHLTLVPSIECYWRSHYLKELYWISLISLLWHWFEVMICSHINQMFSITKLVFLCVINCYNFLFVKEEFWWSGTQRTLDVIVKMKCLLMQGLSFQCVYNKMMCVIIQWGPR